MSEVTTDDLKRVYDKMEAADAKNERKTDELRSELNTHIATVNKNLSDLSTSTAVMAERFRQMTEKVDELPEEIPELPDRPCGYFTKHIEEHRDHDADEKENIKLWKRPIIALAIDLVKMGIIFLVAFAWGKSK